MKERIVIALMAVTLPGIAAAQDAGKYQCSYGELQRRVEIAHEPGVQVPCSVHYYKDTETPDEQQVLWSAERDAQYCQTKAEEFVAKLEDWGWDCGQESAPVTESDVVDETDAGPPEEEMEEEMLGDPPESPEGLDID